MVIQTRFSRDQQIVLYLGSENQLQRWKEEKLNLIAAHVVIQMRPWGSQHCAVVATQSASTKQVQNEENVSSLWPEHTWKFQLWMLLWRNKQTSTDTRQDSEGTKKALPYKCHPGQGGPVLFPHYLKAAIQKRKQAYFVQFHWLRVTEMPRVEWIFLIEEGLMAMGENEQSGNETRGSGTLTSRPVF